MQQKDMAGKTLESINEVFSDIANVLLFDGEELIREKELSDAEPRSQYKTDGLYHEQVRDVAKYWNRCGIRMAFIGFENQSDISRYMPLRLISYDGGVYRAQLPKKAERTDETVLSAEDKHKKRKCKKKQLYPAVSLVLYFGTQRKWQHPKGLREVLTIPDRLSPYVSDYSINVVNVAFLEREVIDKFKSDFWYVADYFWQIRNTKDYKPSKKIIKHAYEVLQMMSAMTGDNRFEEVYNEVKRDGGEANMCEFLDKLEARGEARGKAIGEVCGKAKGEENGIRVLIESYTEDGISEDVIAEKLIRKYNLTEEKAYEKIKIYGKRSA